MVPELPYIILICWSGIVQLKTFATRTKNVKNFHLPIYKETSKFLYPCSYWFLNQQSYCGIDGNFVLINLHLEVSLMQLNKWCITVWCTTPCFMVAVSVNSHFHFLFRMYQNKIPFPKWIFFANTIISVKVMMWRNS